MKKKANELEKGDNITVGSEKLEVENMEISDISKQGTKKCRIEAKRPNGEKVVLIRPANYPFSTD